MTDKPVTLTPLTKPVHLHFSGARVALPNDLQAEIDGYWQTRIDENPHLFNGECFTLTDFVETPTEWRGELDQTTFAHSLYSFAHDIGDYAYRVIHTACLVITSDNKLIIGEMHQNTARAGVICCSGGGLDKGDLRDDGMLDLDYSTAHELQEELGINPTDDYVLKFGPQYIKTGGAGDKITVLYELRTSLTSKEFAERYQAFVDELEQSGGDIEYACLFYIDNTPEAIEAFIAEYEPQLDTYLAQLLRIVNQRAA